MEVAAQESSQTPPSPRTIELELSDTPQVHQPPDSGRSRCWPACSPKSQGLDSRRTRSNSAIGRLINPFDGGAMPQPSETQVREKSRGGAAPLATKQTAGPGFVGGRMGVSRARNPFDAGYGQPPRGLLERASPQAVPCLLGPSPVARPGRSGSVPGRSHGPRHRTGRRDTPSTPALPSAMSPSTAAPAPPHRSLPTCSARPVWRRAQARTRVRVSAGHSRPDRRRSP